jgi:hypothetical protein
MLPDGNVELCLLWNRNNDCSGCMKFIGRKANAKQMPTLNSFLEWRILPEQKIGNKQEMLRHALLRNSGGHCSKEMQRKHAQK